MPVETLYNLKADAQLQAQVRKWYGPPSDKEIEGISLLELACILEEKGINENMFMIEQSLAFCDHDNLYKNLRRIGKEYLVPRCQNVLRLIRAFRIALRDFKLNRGLGSMHHILFPQDTELIRHAHNSRTDVEMTYKQAGADFAGTEKGDRPPGIQTYFKKGKDKWLINLPAIDATSGDLLLPQSFETIQDTQGSDNVRKPGPILTHNADAPFRQRMTFRTPMRTTQFLMIPPAWIPTSERNSRPPLMRIWIRLGTYT